MDGNVREISLVYDIQELISLHKKKDKNLQKIMKLQNKLSKLDPASKKEQIKRKYFQTYLNNIFLVV